MDINSGTKAGAMPLKLTHARLFRSVTPRMVQPRHAAIPMRLGRLSYPPRMTHHHQSYPFPSINPEPAMVTNSESSKCRTSAGFRVTGSAGQFTEKFVV